MGGALTSRESQERRIGYQQPHLYISVKYTHVDPKRQCDNSLVPSIYELKIAEVSSARWPQLLDHDKMGSCQAIKDTPIVQQSVVWALSASSIPIGIAMSMALDGREGRMLKRRVGLFHNDELQEFVYPCCGGML